MFFLKCPV